MAEPIGRAEQIDFKVKIMLLDFQTTVMLVTVVVATILSVITLMHTNIR